MQGTVEKFVDGNRTLRIEYDDASEACPRQWDNLCEILSWDKKSSLGDKHEYESIDDFICTIKPKDVVVALYKYEHGGIMLSTAPFNNRFDSGQIGCVIIRHAHAKVEIPSEYTRNDLLEFIENELKAYNQWLAGEVYGYIEEETKVVCKSCGSTATEEVESCWGFYGNDWKENGLKYEVDKRWLGFF